MKLNSKEKKIAKEARDFIRANKELLIEKFANDQNYPQQKNPVSFFTAGSFGAGKTEFSKRLAERIPGLVLIDADAAREMCPRYDGKRAYIFNSAAFIAQDILQDYVLETRKHFVFDSSFSNYDKAKENIERSLSRNRPVEIYYVYQHPRIAWLFTQVRAQLYGRHISKKAFVRSCIRPREVIRETKQEFGDKITLNLVEKKTSTNILDVDPNNLSDNDLKELETEIVKREVRLNISNLEKYVPFTYTEDTLKESL